MASKEVMVTAPVVVLLFDRTFVSGSFRAALRRSPALYGALSATWLLLLALNLTNPRSQSAGFHLELSPTAWWATQCQVLFLYLKLMVWPYPLLIHYELPYLDTFASAAPWVLGVALLLLGTLVLLARRMAAGFVMAATFLILSPTLVVPIITEVMAERRMYLPSAALVALFVAGGYAVVQRIAVRSARATPNRVATPWIACAAAVLMLTVVFSTVSARRVTLFNDRVALWKDAALHQPQNFYVQHCISVHLLDEGKLDEALPYIEESLRLRPKSIDVQRVFSSFHRLRGRKLFDQGYDSAALEEFNEAIRWSSEDAQAHLFRAILYQRRGDWGAAIPDFRKACKYAEARENEIGPLARHEAAGSAAEGNSLVSSCYNNLAWALAACPIASLRDGREAVATARKACEMADWKSANDLDTLAVSYAEAGDFDNAVRWQSAALELSGDNAAFRKACEERLSLFRQRIPFHEPSGPADGAPVE